MKFTDKDLLEAMGLEFGDIIECGYKYEIKQFNGEIRGVSIGQVTPNVVKVKDFVGIEFDILEPYTKIDFRTAIINLTSIGEKIYIKDYLEKKYMKVNKSNDRGYFKINNNYYDLNELTTMEFYKKNN